MAIPATWAMHKERLRWTAANGALERVQSWRGLAGAGEVTYGLWLDNFSGYTSLERTALKTQKDGNCVLDVEIGFAAQADGTVVPPTSPDYGLIERTWTKHTIRTQEKLQSHWRLNPFIERGGSVAEWPNQVRLAALQYAADLKTYLKNEIAKEPTEEAARYPVATEYLNVAIGDNKEGSNVWSSLSSYEQEVLAWLFAEYVADSNSHWYRNQPVIRKMEIVLSVSNVRPSHENVDRILSPSTFLANEATIEQAALIAWTGLSDMYWHKQSPDVERTSNGLFKITQEYHSYSFIAPNTIMRYGDVV